MPGRIRPREGRNHWLRLFRADFVDDQRDRRVGMGEPPCRKHLCRCVLPAGRRHAQLFQEARNAGR